MAGADIFFAAGGGGGGGGDGGADLEDAAALGGGEAFFEGGGEAFFEGVGAGAGVGAGTGAPGANGFATTLGAALFFSAISNGDFLKIAPFRCTLRLRCGNKVAKEIGMLQGHRAC